MATIPTGSRTLFARAIKLLEEWGWTPFLDVRKGYESRGNGHKAPQVQTSIMFHHTAGAATPTSYIVAGDPGRGLPGPLANIHVDQLEQRIRILAAGPASHAGNGTRANYNRMLAGSEKDNAALSSKLQTTQEQLLKKEDERGEIKKSVIAVFLTCLIVGFYDGFFGPGTGSIFIIALFVINKLSLLQASATSKIFNFASNIGAFVAFLIAGKMAFLIGIPMILANLLGNHFGSLHAINSNGEVIRKVLVVTVLLIIVSMAYKAFSA